MGWIYNTLWQISSDNTCQILSEFAAADWQGHHSRHYLSFVVVNSSWHSTDTLVWSSTASWPCQHISVLCVAWHIWPVIGMLFAEALKTVVRACIWTTVTCCCLVVISDNLLQHLQAVQNAAACLVTGSRRREHITPILTHLHWLQMWQHVELKGELNLDKKWQSDDLFYIIMNEIHPRFNQFCVILKLS